MAPEREGTSTVHANSQGWFDRSRSIPGAKSSSSQAVLT